MRVEQPCCGNDATPPHLKMSATHCGKSIDAALAHQREDWLKGIRIPITDRLTLWQEICVDPIQAAELIYHDFVLRRDSGESPDWDGVLREFPEYEVQLQHFREADDIVEGATTPSGRSIAQIGGYELLDEVGRGGMGVVYRARERHLDRVVAIKRIRGGAFADDDAIPRFLKEAKAVSRLNHPNIVHIYCVGDCDGEPFIALEFVERPSLAERIGGTPLAPRLAGVIGAAVAHAIQHAHEHGIIHRDLKPANILLCGPTDAPVPKVTDFGAAKELHQAVDRERTQFLGTPSYVAPEQVEAKWGTVNQLTDVYGIGVVLYEALTGRPPFRADSIGETLRQVIETEAVSPRLLNPAVPRDLETVCLKCLEKEPARRYGSAAALADDLRRFLDGEPVKARPIGLVGRTWRWCCRKPGTASLVAVLLLTLFGGMAGITVQWRRAEAALQAARASDVEAQELLGELIQSNPKVPKNGSLTVRPAIESLLEAETHCKTLLAKNPSDKRLRIALTRIYGGLAGLFTERGLQLDANTNYGNAQSLWEPVAADADSEAECRNWLATTYFWQDGVEPRPRLQLLQKAVAIWQRLFEERPGDLNLMGKLWECRRAMAFMALGTWNRDDCTRHFEIDRAESNERLLQDPADRAERNRLALICFLLGDIYACKHSDEKASACWHESWEHYNILWKERRDDLLANFSLAVCCSRLIQGPSADAYYLQAVPLLEETGRGLEAMVTKEPQSEWLRGFLLDNYCCLALCHAKVGQKPKAEQIASEKVAALATPLNLRQIEPRDALKYAAMLMSITQLLREAEQPAAALRLTRQVGELCTRVSMTSSHDLAFLSLLAETAARCSTHANGLGEPRLALQQAELSRRATEDWVQGRQDACSCGDMLSKAWQRIGKARWSVGEREQAVAAFGHAAAASKQLFDREPANHSYRALLSSSYDRLVFYGSRGGDLSAAANAILERTNLWPNNARQLTQSAEDFESLAEDITAGGKGQPSAKDRAQRDRYLATSRRFRQAAEEASRRPPHDDLRVER
jgi:hypothetical protein